MPAIVKLRVIAARELPVMDRSSELTDAFVEVELHTRTYAVLEWFLTRPTPGMVFF